MLVIFWLCLFIIKLYSRHDIFKYIQKKEGKDISSSFRSFKTLRAKSQKVALNITFIKTCKRESLIPNFVNTRLSIKQLNSKLKRHISKMFMENELKRRHSEKRNLKNNIKAKSYELRRLLLTLAQTTVLHQINLAIRSRVKSIVKRQENKLIKFRRQYQTQSNTNYMKVDKHIMHNFSWYVLSPKEIGSINSSIRNGSIIWTGSIYPV